MREDVQGTEALVAVLEAAHLNHLVVLCTYIYIYIFIYLFIFIYFYIFIYVMLNHFTMLL